MKTFKSLLLCIGVLALISATSNTPGISGLNQTEDDSNMDLRGELSVIKPRSLTPRPSGNSLTACLQGKTISVSFLDVLEEIAINIYDSHHNLVYHTRVHVASPQEMRIPLHSSPQGRYSIEFISPLYGYLIGNFTLSRVIHAFSFV